jgi:hypothetical protein
MKRYIKALLLFSVAPCAVLSAQPSTWYWEGTHSLAVGGNICYCYRFSPQLHVEAGVGLRPEKWSKILKKSGWYRYKNYSLIGTSTLSYTLLRGDIASLGMGLGPSIGFKVMDLKVFAETSIRLFWRLSATIKGGAKLCLWGRPKGVKPHLDVAISCSL